MSLHYSSDRADGYKTAIDVPVSGDSIPASLQSFIVECEVAGQTMEKRLTPLPDQKTDFVWDGLDYQGKKVNAAVSATYISVLLSCGLFFLYYCPC